MDTSAHLFHYTGAGALLSIVTRRQLWATYSDALNDRFEGALPRLELKNVCLNPGSHLPSIRDPNPRHLAVLNESLLMNEGLSVTSFSTHWSSLPMHRMYAPPAGGFVIGLPRQYLLDSFDLIEVDYTTRGLCDWVQNYAGRFLEATARLDDGESDIRTLRNKVMTSHNFLRQRAVAGVQFKSSEFVNESEVRIIKSGGATHHRESREGNYLIPYQILELRNDPIEVIISFGPNKDPQLAKASFIHFVQAAQNAGTKWAFHHYFKGDYGFRA